MYGITLAEAVELPNIVTTFSTALDIVKDNVFGMIGVALPFALLIAGSYLAVNIGWRFVKAIR